MGLLPCIRASLPPLVTTLAVFSGDTYNSEESYSTFLDPGIDQGVDTQLQQGE